MEELDESSWLLCMYHVTGQGLALLDTVRLDDYGYPRVDGHSQQVYITRFLSGGVSVVSWEDNRLTTQPTLKCVGVCRIVGVMSPHTLCACDEDGESSSVSVVSVTDDTVTATLRNPEEVRDKEPSHIAVVGDSILVEYEDHNLVLYENSVSSPGTMVTWPAGLRSVCGMSSDGVSRFLVCARNSKTVFVLDVSGKLCGKINVDTASDIWDCAVVDGKLLVGCHNGDIVVMSPK